MEREWHLIDRIRYGRAICSHVIPLEPHWLGAERVAAQLAHKAPRRGLVLLLVVGEGGAAVEVCSAGVARD